MAHLKMHTKYFMQIMPIKCGWNITLICSEQPWDIPKRPAPTWRKNAINNQFFEKTLIYNSYANETILVASSVKPSKCIGSLKSERRRMGLYTKECLEKISTAIFVLCSFNVSFLSIIYNSKQMMYSTRYLFQLIMRTSYALLPWNARKT